VAAAAVRGAPLAGRGTTGARRANTAEGGLAAFACRASAAPVGARCAPPLERLQLRDAGISFVRLVTFVV
jgi:hypothetical protein